MISFISIKDFAIIENTEVGFNGGLNIITGETGAGKSIVIEAISLALGNRADTTYIRSGKEKAVIQLIFSLGSEEYIITREVSSAGKSLCKINGEIVPLSQLNQLCKSLADIHGQYDHQSLLDPEKHIHLLDSYNSKNISALKSEVSSLFFKYTDTKNQLSSIITSYEETLRKRGFMLYELDEISKAKLIPSEDAELVSEIKMLGNSEKIYQNLSGAYSLSYEESPSALDGLKKSLGLLQEISEYSENISSVAGDFSDAYYKISDLCREIRSIRDKISFSREELDNAISRLELIESLKKKYGGSIEKVLNYAESLETQLSYIENIDESKAALTSQLAAVEEELRLSSEKLSGLRKESAKELEQKIMSELRELNFNDAVLSIDFSSAGSYTADGTDKVEFLISANKGEPVKPLAKIASGGEMSRIMLAFKRVIADYDEIRTLIFDEIDSGVSGATASIVGKKLRQIAENHQVLCITHLPQIAAFGVHNYKIQKDSDDSMTYTTIIKLDEDEKVSEIARLIGGVAVTEKAIESARELIDQSAGLISERR